jgi:hypothetical protein
MPNYALRSIRTSVRLVPLALLAAACTSQAGSTSSAAETTSTTAQALQVVTGPTAVAFEYTDVQFPPAGVAAGEKVLFVGDPLEARVFALARVTGKIIGELPQPPGGFALPFIMHELGAGRVGVLAAGGLPNPATPSNPNIYEYTYALDATGAFSATLARTVSFANEVIGFPEDFVRLDDGRELMSDAVLGAVWVVQTDGTVTPGIVPKSLDPSDAIPQMVFCPTMPEVTVNGVPFLFTGSTIPGIEAIAVRNGWAYYHSPCAHGLYKFPIAVLSDNRQPWQRAADIQLVAPSPPEDAIEELLDLQFNPYDLTDPYMYAAHGMQLEVLRIDSRNGDRQVIVHDPRLFDFPSSLAFLPPPAEIPGWLTSLVVVSNQQERTPLTNDAVTTDSFITPFPIAKVFVAGP